MKIGGAAFWDANIRLWAEAARTNDPEAKRMLRALLTSAVREHQLGPHGRAALVDMLERDEKTLTGAPSTATRDERIYLEIRVKRELWKIGPAVFERGGRDISEFWEMYGRKPPTIDKLAAMVGPAFNVSAAVARRIFFAEQKRRKDSAKST